MIRLNKMDWQYSVRLNRFTFGQSYRCSVSTNTRLLFVFLNDFTIVKRTFITNVESGKNRAKYNLNHIDKMADHFGLSPKDFLPEMASHYI